MQLAGIGGQPGNRFRRVNGAASTKADHSVPVGLARQPDTLCHEIRRRFARDRKRRAVNAGFGLRYRAGDWPERALAPCTMRSRRVPCSRNAPRSSPRTPGPKRMRPAVENSKRMAYQPLSSGKILEYLALRRGSAIMGATASRHFA